MFESLVEASERLAQIDAERVELLRAIEQKKREQHGEFIAHIRDLATQAGYEIQEVIDGLSKRPARQVPTLRRYVNPDNTDQTYTRGKLPNWMREAMRELGLDPNEKADRRRYMNDYLVLE